MFAALASFLRGRKKITNMDFMSTLSESPKEGQELIISGGTTENAQNFNITLTIAPVADADAVLHFYVDFAENKIMRSSIVGGIWTETDESPNVLGRGDDFQIQFRLYDDKIHVIINGNVFCDYFTKLSATTIRTIFVAGDVTRVTQCDHMTFEPVQFPKVETDNTDIVFSSFTPSRIKPGHVVVLTGVASDSPDGEFVVMFNENGKRVRQIVHLNVRFDEETVVCNTQDDER
jgi:Galactoside-binding lectin